MTKSLLVVSTRVGGVPEVLPEHMILFGKPEEDGRRVLLYACRMCVREHFRTLSPDLVETVYRAIEKARANAIYPHRYHQEVRQMYSWANVAERTEKVYESAMGMATPSLMDRLKLYVPRVTAFFII